MYNDKVLMLKREIITPIPDYIIPVASCQNNKHVINFTTGDMRSKFEVFAKYKIDTLYPSEILKNDGLKH